VVFRADGRVDRAAFQEVDQVVYQVVSLAVYQVYRNQEY
jgi:hypothetical protein